MSCIISAMPFWEHIVFDMIHTPYDTRGWLNIATLQNIFTLADAMKQLGSKGVVGETKKVAKAKNVATSESLNEGQKVKNTVIFTKAQPKKINANKKVFSIDEYQAVVETKNTQQPQEYRKKKTTRSNDFPAL